MIEIEWCKKKKSGEAAILKAVQKAAEKMGVHLYRNQVGTYKVEGRWISSGLCVGASDLIGYDSTGRFVAVECKIPGKQASDIQQKFIDRVLYAGGIARVVHSVDELIILVNNARKLQQ